MIRFRSYTSLVELVYDPFEGCGDGLSAANLMRAVDAILDLRQLPLLRTMRRHP